MLEEDNVRQDFFEREQFEAIEHLRAHNQLPSGFAGEYEGETESAKEYFKERREEIELVAKEFNIKINCESRSGHPAKVIVTAADEEHCDLIVIGHSDHSGLWGRLLGDTADRVCDHAHCSVLVVKS